MTTKIGSLERVSPDFDSYSNKLDQVLKKVKSNHLRDSSIVKLIEEALGQIEHVSDFASARSSSLDLVIGLTQHEHYRQERIKAINLFQYYLENDPMTLESSGDVAELAIKVATILNPDISSKIPLSLLLVREIAHCFASIIELNLRHFAANHQLAFPEALKKKLAQTETLIDGLLKASKENITLKQDLRIAREGIRRLKTPENLGATVKKVVAIAHSAVNKDLNGIVVNALEIANEQMDRCTHKWYDDFLICRKLSKDVQKDFKQIYPLLVFISMKETKNWHLSYAAIHALGQIAILCPDYKVKRIAIFGENSSGQKLPGLLDFVSYRKFEENAKEKFFKKLTTGQKYDRRIRDYAVEILKPLFKLGRPQDILELKRELSLVCTSDATSKDLKSFAFSLIASEIPVENIWDANSKTQSSKSSDLTSHLARQKFRAFCQKIQAEKIIWESKIKKIAQIAISATHETPITVPAHLLAKQLNSIFESMAKEGLDEVSEIPSFLSEVIEDSWPICNISQKPIRFIVVPSIPAEFLTDQTASVKYDRNSLEQWLKEHPEIQPPGWPASLPISRTAFKQEFYQQRKIDQNLKIIFKKIAQNIIKLQLV